MSSGSDGTAGAPVRRPAERFVPLRQERTLTIPHPEATERLAALAGSAEGEGGSGLTLRIKPHVKLEHLGAEIAAYTEIVVSVRPRPVGEGVAVTWSGAREDAFPCFEGRLTVETATPPVARLRLDGEYRGVRQTLRLAAAGESAVGHRLVTAVAREILGHVARRLEVGPDA